MSDIFDRYEYLKKLWSDFYGLLRMNEETEEMTQALENQLDKKTRWGLQGKFRMRRSFWRRIRK